MKHMTQSLLECENGATAIEYAFIASLVSIAAVAGMMSLGNAVQNMMDMIASVF